MGISVNLSGNWSAMGLNAFISVVGKMAFPGRLDGAIFQVVNIFAHAVSVYPVLDDSKYHCLHWHHHELIYRLMDRYRYIRQ